MAEDTFKVVVVGAGISGLFIAEKLKRARIDFTVYAGRGFNGMLGGTGNDGFFFGDGRFNDDVVDGKSLFGWVEARDPNYRSIVIASTPAIATIQNMARPRMRDGHFLSANGDA